MKKKKEEIKKNSNILKFIIIILILAFLLRLPNLNNVIVFDEYIQTNSVLNHNSAGLEAGPEIPPLTTWTRILFTSIFGFSTFNIKLVSLIFGLLTLLIVYLIAKELYNEKIALISISLLALSAWHILVTTSISFDGAFLSFYYLLTLFFFIKYIKYNTNKWLYLTGLGFGLAMLTKYNAILLVPTLFAYYLFEKNLFKQKPSKKDVFKILKSFLTIGIIGFFVFLVFPISAYLSDFSEFTITLGHTNQLKSTGLNISLLLIQYMQMIFWAGPLFIGLYLLSLRYYDKKDFLLHTWVFVNFFFYTFVVGENSRPIERYLVVLLPVICILGAKAIANFKFERKNLIIFSTVLILWLSALFCMNLSYNDILPFYPKTEFINRAISLDWNFLVPFTGDQGPLGMYVAFNSIAYSFILCFVFILLFLISKKWNKEFFFIFLAVALAFNIFMVIEMTYSLTNPDIDLATNEAINYANNKGNFNEPIFVFRNYGLEHYLFDKYSDIVILDFEKLNNFAVIQPSTVLIVDFPKIGESNTFWKKLNENCRLEFISKNQIGRVYAC